MAYVSTEQLSARLGAPLYARLTDRVNGATADTSVAQQIVAEAEAEANAWLARRYQTPVDLSAHPELVSVLQARVLDLAEYVAWKGSPFVSDPPQRVQMLYAGALRWLEDVAGGRLVLPASAPPTGPVAAPEAPRYAGGARVWTSAELDGL